MNKLANITGAFALWMLALVGACHAGVPCSVPNNLQNNTIADATQVMANYNALIACLGNAAAAGANSDITALNALVTPITPTQGGNASICGATGYKVVNNAGNPTTRLDVSAGRVVMQTAAGVGTIRTSVAVTINFAVNGANGLDTGALASDTPYYIYLIDNGVTTAGLASASSTAPVIPSGYTASCRLSSAATFGATFPTLITFGAETHYVATFSNSTAIGTCFTGLTSTPVNRLPATATYVMGTVFSGTGGKAAVGSASGNSSEVLVDYTSITGQIAIAFRVPIFTPSTIFVCASGTGNVALYGWVDNTNAH